MSRRARPDTVITTYASCGVDHHGIGAIDEAIVDNEIKQGEIAVRGISGRRRGPPAPTFRSGQYELADNMLWYPDQVGVAN